MAKKVLVVDDEKLIVKGIRFSLEQDGHGGGVRLRRRRSSEYGPGKMNTILSFWILCLPKLNGLEVCQQIREFSNVPHRYADGQGRRHGQDSGAGVRGGRLYYPSLLTFWR